jgi:hypothetical protein
VDDDPLLLHQFDRLTLPRRQGPFLPPFFSQPKRPRFAKDPKDPKSVALWEKYERRRAAWRPLQPHEIAPMSQIIQKITYELDDPELEGAAFVLRVTIPTQGQIMRSPFLDQGSIVSWAKVPADESARGKPYVRTVHGFEGEAPVPGSVLYLSSLEIEGIWYHLFL